MIKLENLSRENPKLCQRVHRDGRISLYLEYYLGRESEKLTDEHGEPMLYKSGAMAGTPIYRVKHLRKKENLSLYLVERPKTPVERQQNRETIELAKKIRKEREQQFLEDREGYRLQQENKNLLAHFTNFVEHTTVADQRLLKSALKQFRDFLAQKYPQFSVKLEAKQLSPKMMKEFCDHLCQTHRGQGIETYWHRFKRIINYHVDGGLIPRSPCRGINPPQSNDTLAKDILSGEELQKLFATHYKGENPEIRRAFAMTCFCGVRRCDVVRLQYSNVDYGNKLLTFRQAKTEGHSSKSGVTIPLSDGMLAIIGTKQPDAKDDFIFHIPSDTMCLKALRHWTKKAGIDKHITWHCGRHSFATVLLANGANIKVVSELLGHSTLKFTEIYVRALDKQKRDAIDSLPQINI